jgi:hypothetical protein
LKPSSSSFNLQLRTLDNFNSSASPLRARRGVEHLRRGAGNWPEVSASPLVPEVAALTRRADQRKCLEVQPREKF